MLYCTEVSIFSLHFPFLHGSEILIFIIIGLGFLSLRQLIQEDGGSYLKCSKSISVLSDSKAEQVNALF